MQPLQLSDFLSEHCGSSCATSFQSVEISGVESAPLGRVWVFYRVARPGFWPDYTSTITSVWCPSLYLPLLWHTPEQYPGLGAPLENSWNNPHLYPFKVRPISITQKVPIGDVPPDRNSDYLNS